MADVFLSYSSKDRAAAERVEAALSAQGIDVFWDQETPPGVDWDTWIRDKLATCKAAVVLWSKASIASPNVRHEAIVARDAGKLVPAMIETLAASDFPMGLYLVQAVNLQDWRNAKSGGMERLVAEVQARMGRGPAAGAARPKASRPKEVRPQSPWLFALPVLVIAISAGVVWWIWNGQNNTPAPPDPAPVETAAAPVPGDPQTDKFSTQMVGRWHWDGQPCESGTAITLESGRLVFATTGSVKFVHAIESDNHEETRTRVLSPDFSLGEQYSYKPEYQGTNDPAQSFLLVLQNLTAKGDVNRWYRC